MNQNEKIKIFKNGKFVQGFPTLGKAAEYFNISYSIFAKLLNGKTSIVYKGFSITKEISKAKKKEELEFEEFKRALKNSFKKRKIIIPEWAWKVEETKEEKERKERWERHCSKCCTKSIDNKVWLPKSITTEFPKLRYYTLPKCMF